MSLMKENKDSFSLTNSENFSFSTVILWEENGAIWLREMPTWKSLFDVSLEGRIVPEQKLLCLQEKLITSMEFADQERNDRSPCTFFSLKSTGFKSQSHIQFKMFLLPSLLHWAGLRSGDSERTKDEVSTFTPYLLSLQGGASAHVGVCSLLQRIVGMSD